jgi:hypothetical protein
MARSEQEIIDSMGTPPAGLTFEPASDAAKWRNMFALGIRIFEGLFDRHVLDVREEIQQNRYGSQRWYRSAAMSYQNGDSIELDANGVAYYQVVDPSKRIVTAVSAREGEYFGSQMVLLKVAKTVNGELAPLTSAELSGLRAYIEFIRPFGVKVDTISTQSDLISVRGLVYLNSLIAVATVENSVKDAMATFRDTLVFDGIAKKSDLIRAIANVDGVYSVGNLSFRRRSYLGTQYTEVVNASLDAGYFNYADLSIQLVDGNNNTVRTITAL